VPGSGRAVEALRLRDGALDGHLVVDFAGLDAWYEEDERNVGHPRDPFHRIDIVHGSRHVEVRADDGTLLADSFNPHILFEPPLPVRYYLPREDVRMDLLTPADTRSTCAYKGHATYWSYGDQSDVAWTYEDPLREASEITGRIAFFNERVDVLVDGEAVQRPVTEWSRR
jgi:uncharacterized protein (DUF427 family)